REQAEVAGLSRRRRSTGGEPAGAPPVSCLFFRLGGPMQMFFRLPHSRLRQDSIQAARTLAVVLALAAAPAARAHQPLLWASLQPGPPAVGSRALHQLAHPRQYDPEYPAAPAPPPAPRPRPILIGLWYPARATNTPPFAHAHYLDVPSDDPVAGPFARRLMPHMREVVCDGVFGKKTAALSPAEAAPFAPFLAIRT